MKANELRIGNWVKSPDEGITDVGIGHFWHEFEYGNDYIEFFEPIPITEEWLLKFGFAEVNYSYVIGIHQQIFSGLMKFDFNERLNSWEFSIGEYNDLTRVKYVHQLQNLYFALTGEELTFYVKNNS